jgi:hypothetical protein
MCAWIDPRCLRADARPANRKALLESGVDELEQLF